MFVDALYDLPGFYEFGDEAPKEQESDDDLDQAPVETEPMSPEEEAMLESVRGLFFDMRDALEGVFEGEQKAPATFADPEALKKAMERQSQFIQQFYA